MIIPEDVSVRISKHQLRGCDDNDSELCVALDGKRYPRMYWFLGRMR